MRDETKAETAARRGPQGVVRYRFVFWCLYVVLLTQVLVLAAVAVARAGGVPVSGVRSPLFRTLVGGWSSSVALMVVAFLGRLSMGNAVAVRRSPRAGGFGPWVSVVVAVVAASVTLDAVIDLLGLSAAGHLGILDRTLGALSWSDRVAFLGVMAVLPGWAEESFFRGFLLERARQVGSPVAAVLLSSALFGLFHADWVHGVATFLLGAVLGCSFLWTGRLDAVIWAHGINNALATLLAGTALPLAAETRAGAGLALLLVAMGALWRRRFRPDLGPPT